MTTDELKEVLDATADTFTFIDKEYSKELSDMLRSLLVKVTPEVMKFITDVFDIEENVIKTTVTDLKNVLDGMDTVFLSETSPKVVDFCERLQGRPIILKLLAWQLG